MLKTRILLAAPAVFALAAIACSAEVAQPEVPGTASDAVQSGNRSGGNSRSGSGSGANSGSSSGSKSGSSSGSSSSSSSSGSSSSSSSSGGSGSVSCPSGSNDDLQRAAANTAFGVMRAAAAACGGASAGPCWGTTILASQRYRVASGNKTIEFDPTDPQYANVPAAARASLAIGQLDATVGAFLVAGLQWDQANTNGTLFPLIEPLAALANFTYPGSSTPITIQDPAAGNNRRKDVVTGTSWCNTEKVHFADTSSFETGFAPFTTVGYANFYGATKPAYTGKNSYPSTPFNGTGGSNNPYLVVSVNGATLTWNSSTWPTHDCGSDASCSGTIDIDPIPYAVPGAYYDASGNPVGPQTNPFGLVVTDLYADSSHAGQWATRTVAGVQQWGTFSTALNVLGTTVYLYVKQM